MACLQLSVPHLVTTRFKHRPVRCASERQELFNHIAPVYYNLNDLLSFGQHRIWRAKSGNSVLDLCCGSGDLTFLMSEKVGSYGKVTGLDFSKEQLSIASSQQSLFSKACYNNIDSRVSILDFKKSTQPFTSLFQEWMIDNVVVPTATVYGLAKEYKYLKTSIDEFLTGKELEKLALDAGFSYARHDEIGGGLMGNLVATR
ncbi:hypothetical protein REPUB_Repub04eG0180800 [Reevesia pubescens]